MKKILLTGLLVSSFLIMASCSDDKENSFTSSRSVPAYNLYTSVSGVEDAVVLPATYVMTTKSPEMTVSLAASNMSLPGGGKGNLTTIDMPFNISGVEIDGYYCETLTFTSESPYKSGLSISKLSGSVTQAAYNPGDVEVPGYDRIVPNPNMGRPQNFCVFDYLIGTEWRVRSFWPDMTFCGTTVTTFPGMTGPYSNDKIAYRVIMHRDDNGAILNKADIIFYNAQFAPQAPEITVVLRDLTLNFNNNGYKISGTDIVPDMVEAGALQPVNRYKFDSFNFVVQGNLTSASASYSVAGMFNGSFSGSSIKWNN